MEFRAGYRIISELNLVLHYLEGDVTFELLKKFREGVFSDPHYQPHYLRLNDFRNANFIANSEIINNYSQFEQTSSKQTPKKIAIITSTPEQVVASKLYEFYSKDKSVVDVASTVEKACAFLLIDANKVQLIINELLMLKEKCYT